MANKSIAKLAIFTALLMCAPSFYFIAVAAGFIPAIFYLYYIFGDSDQSVLVLWGTHLLVYTALFYFISHIVTNALFKIKNSKNRAFALTIILSTLIMGSFFPIYTIGGHSSSQAVNIIGMYKKADQLSYVPW